MDVAGLFKGPYRAVEDVVKQTVDMKSAEGAKYREIALHGALWAASVFLLWRYSEKIAV